MAAFKYAHILEAMAQEAKTNEQPWDIIEYKNSANQWIKLEGAPMFSPEYEYRIKPKIIMIGDREVSEPVMFDYAELDTWYYYPGIKPDFTFVIHKFQVFGSNSDSYCFKFGLVRKTEEEAQELGEALICVLKKALGVQE